MAPSIHTQVPALRIRPANSRPVGANGARVIYWMIASRRVRFNFALQRAADWSRDLGLPLVILEALRSDYPWASDRLHRFVADGMADTSAALEGRNVAYIPCRDPEPREADAAVASIRDPHRGPDHDGGGYPHRLSNPLAGNPLALADRDRGLGTEPSFCRPSIPGTVSTVAPRASLCGAGRRNRDHRPRRVRAVRGRDCEPTRRRPGRGADLLLPARGSPPRLRGMTRV